MTAPIIVVIVIVIIALFPVYYWTLRKDRVKSAREQRRFPRPIFFILLGVCVAVFIATSFVHF